MHVRSRDCAIYCGGVSRGQCVGCARIYKLVTTVSAERAIVSLHAHSQLNGSRHGNTTELSEQLVAKLDCVGFWLTACLCRDIGDIPDMELAQFQAICCIPFHAGMETQ